MSEFTDVTAKIMEIIGASACSIVDIESGQCLARSGVCVTNVLESAALVNARMLRSKLRMVHDHYDEGIEDILITLDRHYHLIRLVRVGSEQPHLFLYLVLQRAGSNLAIARRRMAEAEQMLITLPGAADRIEMARIYALNEGIVDEKMIGSQEELPPFMRDDVAIKLLGINLEDSHAFSEYQWAKA